MTCEISNRASGLIDQPGAAGSDALLCTDEAIYDDVVETMVSRDLGYHPVLIAATRTERKGLFSRQIPTGKLALRFSYVAAGHETPEGLARHASLLRLYVMSRTPWPADQGDWRANEAAKDAWAAAVGDRVDQLLDDGLLPGEAAEMLLDLLAWLRSDDARERLARDWSYVMAGGL